MNPELVEFPWSSAKNETTGSNTTTTNNNIISAWDRLFINGKCGKWYHLSHSNISPNYPEAMYMDEHSLRIRAGILNIITWMALMNIFSSKTRPSSTFFSL
mmetsp:Transcript_27366/g.38690  ORF Transcript_27366/g.38690 Transcript_27366/m.38690 type:complete len:101 (+) Transcript_27366:847-1149(+)